MEEFWGIKVQRLPCIDAIDNAISIERSIGSKALNGNHEDFQGYLGGFIIRFQTFRILNHFT
jgi:hypothetical protein